jgi:hypothetical protein
LSCRIRNLKYPKRANYQQQFKKDYYDNVPVTKKSEDIKTKDLSKLHDKQEEQAVLL